MTVEQHRDIGITSEFQEIVQPTSPRWFGGALEAGAVIAFGIQRRLTGPKTGHVAAYPFIAFREPNETFIDLLKSEYGGSKMKVGDSWEWRLSGYRAAEIIASMEPYVVSRREVVLAARNWLESETAERVRIAEDMKGYDRYQEGSVEDYEELVEDPIFVAGVVDNRGKIFPFKDEKYTNARVDVYSKNKNLLDALQEQYGGQVYTVVEVGDEGVLRGRAFKTKRASYLWTIVFAGARDLIQSVADHLKIPPYEGWDRRLIDAVRREKEDQVERIRGFVQDELEKYERGEIIRLSTAKEIGERFGLTERTTERRISQLPVELKKEREKIIRVDSGRLSRNNF